MTPIVTIVLAGGPADAVAALEPGAPNKAFVRIARVTLVARTIAGLRAAPSIGRIIVVAPIASHDDPALDGSDERRPDGVKIRESLRNGLVDLPPDELVLVATSDMPILTGQAVEDFIERARRADPDLGYGCLEKATHLARFPEVPHTWVRLRDGTFCGGGLMVIKPRMLPALDRVIERLGAARKNPLALASLFGWRILAKFALGRLSIAEAEKRASDILGADTRAIVSPYPETAVNVDRVTDVALAEKLALR
ncbi:MAG TPA: NTP transferase domain-containing protein [Verrucomicrobiae bacterium]|nr:NTP transferase domain-containing protein [Verrucomicrobiae bacterium]